MLLISIMIEKNSCLLLFFFFFFFFLERSNISMVQNKMYVKKKEKIKIYMTYNESVQDIPFIRAPILNATHLQNLLVLHHDQRNHKKVER